MKNDTRYVFGTNNTAGILQITQKGRRLTKWTTDDAWRSAWNSLPYKANRKCYFEFVQLSPNPLVYGAGGLFFGVTQPVLNLNDYPGMYATGFGFYLVPDGTVHKYQSATGLGTITTWAANDIFGVAFDPTTGKLWLAKNNVWLASGDPVAGTNPVVTLGTDIVYYVGYSQYNPQVGLFNFDAEDLLFAPPEGFYTYGASSILDYGKLCGIASWPLNEITGSVVTDSKNSLIGTLSGSPSLNQLGVFFESTAQAIQFDGVDDKIDFPDIVLSGTVMASSWSVDFFVKVISASADDVLLYMGSTTSDKSDQIAIVVGPTDDRYLKVLFHDSTNTALTSLVATAASLGTFGSWSKWLHVALVKSGTDTCTLYVNGVQMDSQSIVGLPTVARTVFRAACDEGSNYSNILLCSVTVYNSAMTAHLVNKRFFEAVHRLTYYSAQALGFSTVGYWSLAETTGLTVYDLSAQSRNGALYGTVTYAEQSARVLADSERSMRFDGATTCVEFADASWNKITSNLSVSAWVMHDGTAATADEGILTKYIHDTGYTNQRAYALVWQADNKIRFYVSVDGSAVQSVVTTAALSLNTLYHVVAVYTPGSKLELYINGTINATVIGSVPASLYASNAPLYIGNHLYLRTTSNVVSYFSGWLSHVTLHNIILTASYVNTLYKQGIEDNFINNISLVTLNPSDKSEAITLTNNNFSAYSVSSWRGVRTTLGRRYGKFYFEVWYPIESNYVAMALGGSLVTSGAGLEDLVFNSVHKPFAFFGDTDGDNPIVILGNRNQTSYLITVDSFTKPPVVLGFAVDFDTGCIWFAYNNTWIASGNPETGANPTIINSIYGIRLFPALYIYKNDSARATIALAQQLCIYAPPNGFLHWDQSGAVIADAKTKRVSKTQLEVIHSTPIVPTTRVSKTQMEVVHQTPSQSSTMNWARLLTSLIYQHTLSEMLYTHHLYAIVKKPSASTVYKLSGVVTLATHAVQRYVRAHKMTDGTVVGTTTSHPTTGYFEILTNYNKECYIIAFDDLDSPDLSSLIYDRVLPIQVV